MFLAFVSCTNHMAYNRSMTSSHSSDNNPRTRDSSTSWPSGGSENYEWIWDSTRRAERLPPTPPPTESSIRDEEVDIIENMLANFGVGEWVSLEEYEHARRLAVISDEQANRILELEHALYNSQDQEVHLQSFNDMLAERVADISCKYCLMGIEMSAARALAKKLKMALVVVTVLVVALLFK